MQATTKDLRVNLRAVSIGPESPVVLRFDLFCRFVSALKARLERRFPAAPHSNATEQEQYARVDHLFYKDVNYFVEYTPLMVVYVFAFLYLYFSVREYTFLHLYFSVREYSLIHTTAN